MITTVLVMGEPGSGKTTLMRRLIHWLGSPAGVLQNNVAPDGKRLNYAKATVYPLHHVVLFGVYDGSPYDGTDRLGRNTQPCAEVLLEKMSQMASLNGYTVVMEGDRLTTASFLETAKRVSDRLIIIWLQVEPQVGEARRVLRVQEDKEWLKTANPLVAGKPRREGRNEGQDKTWLAGRQTKLRNIAKLFHTYPFPNDGPDDQDVVFKFLRAVAFGDYAKAVEAFAG